MGYDSTLLCSEEAQESAELGSNDGTSLNGKKIITPGLFSKMYEYICFMASKQWKT